MRRLPVGAEVTPEGTHFRVWAPKREKVEVVVDGRAYPLAREEDGYFSRLVRASGSLYRYRLDGQGEYPDPASRHQPEGPHGPSRIVDPTRFEWTDQAWKGPRDRVLYEMHVGTFTPEGTWAAAMEKLPHLVDLGITIVEMMPVSEFAGRRGWGYDGVNLYAPTRLYGGPDDLRRFVDRAHALGLGVILDVVYNHLGPDGNYLAQFSDRYFTDRHATDWGEAIDYESAPVRELFVANAGYWIDEYHLDGLRFDATQNIYHHEVLALMTRRAREAAGGRALFLVAENEPQDTRLLREFGFDAMWNDDFHHTALVALTGRREAYYKDYRGTPQEFISCAKWGFLFQGQYYAWQKKRRGTRAKDLPPSSFVVFLENHDQVANTGLGKRLHQRTSPGRLRALTALTLLSPAPMLFQGQEWASSKPFLYFTDHRPELQAMVDEGRAELMSQFESLAVPLDPPGDPRTFERCKLDWSEKNPEVYALHKHLLALRRPGPVEGAVLGDRAFVLRWSERALVVNLGADLDLDVLPEPLLAAPGGWRLLWSSEDPRYGGSGTPPIEDEEGRLHVLGESAVLLEGGEP